QIRSEGKPKVLGRGCGGEPFFRRVSPTKAVVGRKSTVKREAIRPKIKSAISKISRQKGRS
ncbi:MAG: hypothetical protein K6B74_09760, partial [Ruminococcus sp.]|nr:hypothetical protein [Ruminococcus sp.]